MDLIGEDSAEYDESTMSDILKNELKYYIEIEL